MNYYINPFEVEGFKAYVLREEFSMNRNAFILYVGDKSIELDVKDSSEFSHNKKWNRKALEEKARELLKSIS